MTYSVVDCKTGEERRGIGQRERREINYRLMRVRRAKRCSQRWDYPVAMINAVNEKLIRAAASP